ncbi:phosphotransferase [Microbacterium sp. BWT-B31]|uniref:phosphotransferase n=1 Tax=Microbacterium sp. BWT-B31 TaxID=3232072 RepID=UPI003527F720
MARSPLTLAASVTSALPGIAVVGAGLLTEAAAGRYDSAVADLEDGRRVVVRAPADPAAAPELAAEARALRALTPGVRGLLPFRAPELLGEAGVGEARAIVVDFLPGYRVDAAHLPAGRGAATSIGEALAALHALPVSIARAEGLPARTAAQVRHDVERLIDRAQATRRAPADLIARWRTAAQTDRLWRFESAVVLGGAGAASFLFEDVGGAPTVTGLLDWHGLSVGDPATDLQWLSSAPAAAADVLESYTAHSHRAPDALVHERSRLYAELEFANWLLHGVDTGRDDIVDDAVHLLESLAAGVRGVPLLPDPSRGVDDALALLDRTPDASPAVVDTSMQTDAYDPDLLAQWVRGEPGDADAPADEPGTADAADAAPLFTDEPEASTAPIDISDLTAPTQATAGDQAPERREPDSPVDADAEADAAERASRAAFQRWTSSASE